MDIPSLLRVVGRDHADVRGRSDEHDGAKDRACSHGGNPRSGPRAMHLPTEAGTEGSGWRLRDRIGSNLLRFT